MLVVERMIVTLIEVNTGVVVFEPQPVIVGINATVRAAASKYPKNRICFLFIVVLALPPAALLFFFQK
jgi:hypothetical protein